MLRQADDADPTQPAPGLAELGTLVAGARRAGLETTLTVTGTAVPLPAAADLAAYRIIQESLTNTIRHAGPATATVSVSYPPTTADRGHRHRAGRPQPPPRPSGGYGLAGMRERAAAVGGSMDAGPAPGGGFLVTARLPRPRRPGRPCRPATGQTHRAAPIEEGGRP